MLSLDKILLLSSLTFLASCTCGTPLNVTAIQAGDKKLACKDVILEINEAEHYRSQAAGEKGINFGEALMPVCWVSGYVGGAEAIKSANARIDYLGKIYDLLDCGGHESGNAPRSMPPAPVQVIQPAPVISTVPYSAPPQKPGSSHYRLEDGVDSKAKMHEHRDSHGKIYIHSHPHKGPHRHVED